MSTSRAPHRSPLRSRTARVALAWALASTVGCGIQVGSGQAGTDVRDVDAFDAIESNLFALVAVEVGADEQQVVVECDAAVLDFIETTVTDDTLVIDEVGDVRILPGTPCSVNVSVPTLASLSASGSGNVELAGTLAGPASLSRVDAGALVSTGLEAGDLVLFKDGSGSMELEGLTAGAIAWEQHGTGAGVLVGTASSIAIEGFGAGSKDGRDLVAALGTAVQRGSGSIFLHATDRATIDIQSDGAIHLYGSPDVEVTGEAGIGQLVHHD